MQRYSPLVSSTYDSSFSYDKVRTLLPFRVYRYATPTSLFKAFYQNEMIEIIRFDVELMVNNMQYCFTGCINLRHVFGILDVRLASSYGIFTSDAVLLETIYLKHLTADIDLNSCSFLSMDSIQYMITNAANTNAITITVHPDVYAKLTDESNEEWYALLTLAASKNIQFATV